ncbi:hypothetical protein BDR22DRAFT_248869 [Usnea florida]
MLITTPRWVSLSMMSVQLEVDPPAWDQIESHKSWIQETGTLIDLCSPWDDGTTLMHGVPLIAVERFVQQYLQVATVHPTTPNAWSWDSAQGAGRMHGRFSDAILQNGQY